MKLQRKRTLLKLMTNKDKRASIKGNEDELKKLEEEEKMILTSKKKKK
jgi:hydroxyethylthiazole kinase-like sugar kinase family protein